MTIYEDLRREGFQESLKGPVVSSGLADIIERLEASRNQFINTQFAIVPGYLVPEARPKNYPVEAFEDSYVVFLSKSD